MTTLGSALGGTFISPRTLRIASTIPITGPKLRSAASSTCPLWGYGAARTESAQPAAFTSARSTCQSSSVMNGMNGCSSRYAVERHRTSTACAAWRRPACSPESASLASSMYQSHSSCQTNW